MTRRNSGASPPYPFQHSGPCIVAGNAWNLHEDLAAAGAIFGPETPIIAVNGAAREVKAIGLFSFHPERMVERGFEWIRHQRRLFGPDFTVHASRHVDGCEHVGYWWEDARGKGSSIWGARKVAWLIGFDPVVLCGAPLIAGPYAQGHGMGGMMTDDAVTAQYAAEIAADTDWHEGAFSMSGRTAEILGAPE